ncbi:hypothetical protein LTR78_009149 [Recurvomyces mirabilis]|uniref:Lytic polysaccharide monooxygenase n=1 Tax=Recurvomyces mirabilis TaxID=574656 RepID=A0AAE0WFH6_9PEZI|nr:hypothetical protein LTR78_009149 [Recurvomyces mirabilis]KAK5161085.1 hypothetical protein LTS14_000881 [Recurvomyces mirabilis]
MPFHTILSALMATTVWAHMELHSPASFNSTHNPHRTTPSDPYLQYPYDCCGPNDRWTYPCRGYLSLLGTPQGLPTATWEAGSMQTWNLTGIGNHYGGSCQVGFSVDGGNTFRVATSYEGNCPYRKNGVGPGGQDFAMRVPADLATGVQVFAWIWYNREQEFNMNCAAVNITAPTSTPGPYALLSTQSTLSTIPFSSRPEMFIADDGNGCSTPHTTAELKYPLPGPDVVMGDGEYPLALPSGNCSAGNEVGMQGYGGEMGEDGHATPSQV